MRNKAFLLGSFLSLANIGVNVWMYFNGLMALGVLLCIGTILVFAAGIIWLIYQGDSKLHFRRGWVALPLGVFGYAMALVLKKSPVNFTPTRENLELIGGIMMSKYQIGAWMISIILFFVFIIGASLMVRRRA